MGNEGGKNGRADGRPDDEIRPVRIYSGVLNRAHGSSYIEWGKSKLMVGVFGPRKSDPQEISLPDRARLNCIYNMAPFSGPEGKKQGRDRRSLEISKVLSEALSRAVLIDRYPKTVIDVNIEVLEADAGAGCAALSAASVALADAGIQMRDLAAACAVGVVDGRLVLDPSKDEDNFGGGYMPLGILPSSMEIVLLQMSGLMDGDQFGEALDMGRDACKTIHEIQRDALLRKYPDDSRSRVEKPSFSGYGGVKVVITDDDPNPPIWDEEVAR